MKKRKNRRRYYVLGVAALAGVLFAVRALRPVSVTVSPVTKGKAVEAVYATGTVEAHMRVEVRARTPGIIEDLPVREGQGVRKGDLLARIGSPTSQADLRGAQAELAQARRDLDRIRPLAAQGILPKADLDQAESRVETSEARASSLSARVLDTEVRAPIDGMVLARWIEPGQYVSVNEPLFKVGVGSDLVVEVWVDEAEVARVRDGSRAVVTLYAFPNETFLGKVFEILPDANRDRKAYLAKIRLDKPPEGLRSGMTAEVNVVVGEKESVLLAPADAVAQDGSIWVIREGRAHREIVTTGIRDLLKVEVNGSVQEEEPVVVQGQEKLEEGARVEMIVGKALESKPEERTGRRF
ncbi:MAG: efflux RND transporter periplasmic adaptor subunit [Bdellovibrionota bacterium]